jgi:hypothetical protein
MSTIGDIEFVAPLTPALSHKGRGGFFSLLGETDS